MLYCPYPWSGKHCTGRANCIVCIQQERWNRGETVSHVVAQPLASVTTYRSGQSSPDEARARLEAWRENRDAQPAQTEHDEAATILALCVEPHTSLVIGVVAVLAVAALVFAFIGLVILTP